MNEITKELLEALRDCERVMSAELKGLLVIESELEKARAAIYKAEAALAEPQADADEWIPWIGGECPINNGVWFWLRFRNGHQLGPDNGAALWRWDHNHLNEYDIVAYRIAKEFDK